MYSGWAKDERLRIVSLIYLSEKTAYPFHSESQCCHMNKKNVSLRTNNSKQNAQTTDAATNIH